MPENQIWSTEGMQGAGKLTFWREVVNQAVFNLDVALESPSDFSGFIDHHELGAIGLSNIAIAGIQTIKRTKLAIEQCSKGQFEFVVMQQGKAVIEHCGRQIVLCPGDSILIDGQQPYVLSAGKPRSRNMSFHMPAEWLDLWLPDPGSLAGIPIPGESRWGRVINELASAIQGDIDSGNCEGNLCADQLAGLVTLALANNYNAADKNRTITLSNRAKALLMEHAHDREMTATRLAESLSISVRYLHKVLAAAGTSYSQELYSARLELAMRMLKSKAYADLPIAEIAWRSGFNDSSHFFRRFKRQYGCVPGAIRET